MGAVIGSAAAKDKYVSKKVNKWVEDDHELSSIAEDEPQAAYSCYTKAISHRWTYLQRTVPNIGHLFTPLEDAIREKLIPALIGRKISDLERRIFALPVRHGGIGISNPTTTAEIEYNISATITDDLTKTIIAQAKDFSNFDHALTIETTKRMKTFKEDSLRLELEAILVDCNDQMKRNLLLAQEKGAGSWLTALPIKALGFTLNKQEFKDSIYMRYGWDIPNTPNFCHCKKKNDVDHALVCKYGRYVIHRHDRVRDLEAEIMREVCLDVKIEPPLLPIANQELNGNIAEKARLDVSGIGVWAPQERTFIDVRIFHPNAPSHVNKDIPKLYATNEKEKKSAYNERIINVEKGSFTPVVMSTTGGMGKEATLFHKRLALLISEKRNEEYSHVLNYIRTRLRFALLKSTVTALRGVRGKRSRDETTPMSSISYNLIQE